MLKPSVGLILLVSSLFNFFKMVVFPALSKPLGCYECSIIWSYTRVGVQKKNPHFLRLTTVLANNSQKSHRWCSGVSELSEGKSGHGHLTASSLPILLARALIMNTTHKAIYTNCKWYI
jgi:hypothetical protein